MSGKHFNKDQLPLMNIMPLMNTVWDFIKQLQMCDLFALISLGHRKHRNYILKYVPDLLTV